MRRLRPRHARASRRSRSIRRRAIIHWVPNVGGNPIVFLPAGNIATFINGINNHQFRGPQPDHRRSRRSASTAPCSAAPGSGARHRRARRHGHLLEPGRDHRRRRPPCSTSATSSSPPSTSSTTAPAISTIRRRAASASAPVGGFPGAAVITEPGAQIRALEQGSYRRHGRADRSSMAARSGSTARPPMSPARRCEFRVNQGLFDIIVNVGSDNADAARSIPARPAARPAPAPATSTRIYLVAMPKNQAITAILQGDIGFDPAVDVGVENGVIVLSAGANVVGGEVDRYGDLTGTPAARSRRRASRSAAASSAPTCSASRAPTCCASRPARPASISCRTSACSARRSATLSVGAGQTDQRARQCPGLGGARSIRSIPPPIDLTGGRRASSPRTAARIHIFGNATVDASARGLVDAVGDGGSGTGGTAGVSATGGTIVIDGALAIVAQRRGRRRSGRAGADRRRRHRRQCRPRRRGRRHASSPMAASP